MDTQHAPNSMDQNDDRSQTTRLQGESLIIPAWIDNFNFFLKQGESLIIPDTLMIRTIKWRILV